MKRFVTYLYECERGNKSKNVGFIRVNVRGEEGRFEIYIRNLLRESDTGSLYVLVYRKKLMGIKLLEIMIQNGQGDGQTAFQTSDIKETGLGLKDIVGIAVCLNSGIYIASCWKDEYADEIVRGEFVKEKDSLELLEEMQIEELCSELAVAEEENGFLDKRAGITTYEKIDLSQIRDLPSPNWHFTSNSFLVHGFWNYGYLVLKKEMEMDKENLSLGIPGIFEKPEAVMAVLFGFPDFQALPEKVVEAPMNQPCEHETKEKNQEAKVGTMGCWFANLKM